MPVKNYTYFDFTISLCPECLKRIDAKIIFEEGREIVQARQITMFLAKAFTKNSLKTIGEHFGGRDHTTVIHSCQTVKDLMDTDGSFRESVLELQQKVQLAAM